MAIEAQERTKEVYDRIKLALIAHDPTQIPQMFPDLFPEMKTAMDARTEREIEEALSGNDPIEYVTTGFSPAEAFEVLGQLSSEDLGI